MIPFSLVMLCLWALGLWLKANYDVRYQLDSRTQQLELVTEFSQLHAAGVTSTWSDDKHRNRIYDATAPTATAAEVAKKLGIANFPCQLQGGTLRATRARGGKVQGSAQDQFLDAFCGG